MITDVINVIVALPRINPPCSLFLLAILEDLPVLVKVFPIFSGPSIH